MNKWEDRVQEKLNSNKLGQDYEESLLAWKFTGNYKAHNKANASCELCGNTGLRHHYLIAKQETGEALWVGSQCILNFDEGIYGDIKKVRRAKEKETRIKLDEALTEEIMKPIVVLYDCLPQERQRNLHWVVGKFRRRGGFSPGDLVKLFIALIREKIEYQKEVYPVVIRSQQDKVELLNLKKDELESIWGCLTEKQRKIIQVL